MTKRRFILQGLTPNTHAEAVQRVFATPDIQQVILSVAFINEEGVLLLENEIRLTGDKTKVFSGVRNDVTSFQGLARLLGLGATVYVVDTGARNIVFHPKIYLAKGLSEARLVIGSANLTLGGLNNNIEASMAMDFDLSDASQKELVESIENEFLSLPSYDSEHVMLITSEEQLESLKQSGRILDEAEVLSPRPVVQGTRPSNDIISRIHLDVPRKYRTIKRSQDGLVVQGSQAASRGVHAMDTINKKTLKLVWESKPLEERDLNIPSGATTNPTGSMSLDKGLLSEDIDHRHYFRDEVFSQLSWIQTDRPTIEETTAKFELVIRGISYGEFDLRIANSTAQRTYEQHNAMTRLSWGDAREYITQRDLIGRTLSLYRDEENPTRFLLEID
ncbi:MAG: phospholipase D family protein [Candidatus Wildermuthbacteria bacterium]|nr:phospholipase D family protein [Candidatus Wildermuthbacteria bacterium]